MSIASALRVLPRRPGSLPTSVWHLARHGVTSFRDQPQTRMQWPVLRPLCLWVLLVVSVATSERRVHPEGDAFCLLTTRRRRGQVMAMAMGMAFAAPIALLVAVLPVVFWLVVLALAVLLFPSCVLKLKTGHLRARLAASAPSGRLVGIHTVTSVQPGHGAQVVEMVVREADSSGWSLVLDAANERLAAYYSQFGFQPCGEGVLMPWGERVIRMVRRPTREEVR